MAVPARNVFDPMTMLELDAEYDIFQDLVKGMADVKRPIGVRRAIMDDERFVCWPIGGLPFI